MFRVKLYYKYNLQTKKNVVYCRYEKRKMLIKYLKKFKRIQ